MDGRRRQRAGRPAPRTTGRLRTFQAGRRPVHLVPAGTSPGRRRLQRIPHRPAPGRPLHRPRRRRRDTQPRIRIARRGLGGAVAVPGVGGVRPRPRLLVGVPAQPARRGKPRHPRDRYEDMWAGRSADNTAQPLLGPHVNILHTEGDLRFGRATAAVRDVAFGPVEDLVIAVRDEPGRQRMHIEFNANAQRHSLDRLAEHRQRFLWVLRSLVADPDRPVGELDILDPAERHRVLYGWNATRRRTPATTLPALFEAQADRTPHLTALGADAAERRYAQLNARANRLAHHLIRLGAGPERAVALVLPRSVDMVVGMLAVLKAGAVYVPVAPDQPDDRIALLLRDVAPVLTLTTTTTTRS